MNLEIRNIHKLKAKRTEVLKGSKNMKIDVSLLTETKKKIKGNKKVSEYMHIYTGLRKDMR